MQSECRASEQGVWGGSEGAGQREAPLTCGAAGASWYTAEHQLAVRVKRVLSPPGKLGFNN